MKKITKKIASLFLSISVLSLTCVTVSAAKVYEDYGKEVVKTYSYEDGEMGFTGGKSVVEVIDSGDKEHEKVMKLFANAVDNNAWTFAEKLSVPAGTDMVSFDFKAVTDTSIMDVRFYDTKTEKFYGKFYADNGDKTFRLETTNPNRKLYTVGKWHRVDVLFKDQKVSLYLDGEAVQENVAAAYTENSDNWMYIGTLNTTAKPEYHIDNLKLSNTSKAGKLYGDIINYSDKEFKLKFSDTLAKDSQTELKNKVKMYNEETGDEINLNSVEVNADSVVVNTVETLAGGRYAIEIPAGIKSVLGKECYTRHFETNLNLTKFAIDYNDGNVNPYLNEVVEFFASEDGNNTLKMNYSVVDRDESSEDKAVELVTTGGAKETHIRYYPKEKSGENRNVTFEADVMLKQNDKYSFTLELMGASNAKPLYRGIFNGKGQFISFTNPDTSPDSTIRNDYGYATPSWGFMTPYSKDEWHKIKIKLDRENKKGFVYFDNTLVGEYTSDYVANVIERIAIYEYGGNSTQAGSKMLLDNVKLSYENRDDIKDITFVSDGAEYGELDTISPKTFTVKVVPRTEMSSESEIPSDAITVTATNGDNIKASNYSYVNGVLTAEVKNLAPATKYIMTIKGLQDVNGNELEEYKTSFKTEQVEDYGIGFKEKSILSLEEQAYVLAGQYKNQTRYKRNFVTVLAVYDENDVLTEVKIVPQSVPEWTPDYKLAETKVENVLYTSTVKGFIWENMNTMKPYENSEVLTLD